MLKSLPAPATLREMAEWLPCTCGEAYTGDCVRSSINKMVQALEDRRTEA